MRGVAIRAAIAGALLVAGLAIAVAVLNQTVYTPASFVRGYLDALARHDARAALAMTGPARSSSTSNAMLAVETMSDLEWYEVTESDGDGAIRTVSVDFEADGRRGHTEFQTTRTGTVLGMFPTWGFAVSPLVEVDVTVLHARDFTVDGIRFVNPEQDVARTYRAFTPGVYVFGHQSDYTEADPIEVVLGSPEASRTVEIDAEANVAFVELVNEQVHAYLDGCAAQPRLYPTGCPFGHDISDRLASEPSWTIAQYPTVAVQPTTVPGEWTVPTATGIARLDVDVEAIYDGSVTPFSADVGYTIGFVVTFVGADEVVVTPQG